MKIKSVPSGSGSQVLAGNSQITQDGSGQIPEGENMVTYTTQPAQLPTSANQGYYFKEIIMDLFFI